jgi:hypothetical protein
MFKRATTFYVDPVSGNDSNNGTSSATPWKSLANVRTQLAANCTNTAFLFKRGTITRDYTGLSVASSGNYFGAYGPQVAAGKPQISTFTINLAGVTWTNAAGNRWTCSLPATGVNNPSGATSVGWIRFADSPFVNITYCDSTAKVEASTVPAFYFNSGTLHLNIDGDPNGTNFEATPGGNSSVSKSGILAYVGSDKLWVNEIRLDGWGCQCQNTVNNSGFLSGNGVEEVNYVSNCEAYYNGRHTFSQESSGTSGNDFGGVSVIEGCVSGLCSCIGGTTVYNSFSAKGTQECVFYKCTERFGPLPANVTSATYPTVGQIAPTQTFYGHTAGNNSPVGLYINKDCRTVDSRGDVATFGLCTVSLETWVFSDSDSSQSQFLAGTASDPSTYRVFVIGWESPRLRYDSNRATTFESYRRTCFINSRFYARKANTASGRVWSFSTKDGAIFYNCIFDVEVEDTQDIYMFNNGSDPGINYRFMNCLFNIKTSGTNFYLCGAQNTKFCMANCVVMNTEKYFSDSAYNVYLAGGNFDNSVIPVNGPANIRYIANYGCQAADVAPYPYKLGFSGATGYIAPSTGYEIISNALDPSGSSAGLAASALSSFSLDTDHPLVGKGNANPFGDKLAALGVTASPEYSYSGATRPSVPAIGPFDVISTSSGGSSTGGTAGPIGTTFGVGIVGDLVF